MGLREVIAGAFSFLRSSSQTEERVAQYVIREHHRGRPLREVLEDNFVLNRLTKQQLERILDRPEVVRAIGADTINTLKAQGLPGPASS